ncbi:MAG: DnaJ domain-containing protein [Phormidesmis sp.]
MKLAHHYRVLGLRRSASFGEVKKAYRQLVRKYHPDINPDKAAIDQFIQINTAYTALCEALQISLPEAAITDSSAVDSSVTDSGATDSSAADPSVTGRSTHSKASEASRAGVTERLNLQELKLKLEKLGLGSFYKGATAEAPKQPHAAEPAVKQSPESSSESASEPVAESHPPQTAVPAQVFETDESVSPKDAVLKQEAYAQLRILLSQQKFPRAIALVEGLAQRIPSDLEVNQWRAIVYQRWGRQLISQGQFQKARIYLHKALQTDPDNPALGKEVSRDLGLLKHLKSAEATL